MKSAAGISVAFDSESERRKVTASTSESRCIIELSGKLLRSGRTRSAGEILEISRGSQDGPPPDGITDGITD